MTQRKTQKLDFRTGEVTERVTQTSADSIEERFAGLAADASEQLDGPVLASFLAVSCDGCGAVVEVGRPELPEGWLTTERGEFCPACAR